MGLHRLLQDLQQVRSALVIGAVQLAFVVDPPHARPATAVVRLDEQRVPDLPADLAEVEQPGVALLKATCRSAFGSYFFGGTIDVAGIGMPRRMIAQYEVCFSIDWIAHGLSNMYNPSVRIAFLIDSRLVVYECVRRSTTRS